MKTILILCCLFVGLDLGAQTARSARFDSLLLAARVVVSEPLAEHYRIEPVFDNEVQAFDYRLRSKPDQMEIRFLVLPYDSTDTRTQIPHVETYRTVMNLAINDDDAFVAERNLRERDLEAMNAEWAIEYFYQPKTAFSQRYEFARTLAIYREHYGLVLIFMLFDDADNPALDRMYQLARFGISERIY